MQKHQQKCVIQVLPALNSGGVERGTLESSEYLVKKGWRSVVILLVENWLIGSQGMEQNI